MTKDVTGTWYSAAVTPQVKNSSEKPPAEISGCAQAQLSTCRPKTKFQHKRTHFLSFKDIDIFLKINLCLNLLCTSRTSSFAAPTNSYWMTRVYDQSLLHVRPECFQMFIIVVSTGGGPNSEHPGRYDRWSVEWE